MKKLLLKVVSTAVIAGMLFSTAGCGKTNNTSESTAATTAAATTAALSTEEALQPVKISALIGPSAISGVQSGQIFTDVFEKKFGLTVDFMFAGDKFDERLSALMASGDLPDMVCFKDKKQFSSAIDAGALMQLDDLVAKIGANIQSNLPSMLQYMRDNFGKGEGKLYGLASMCGASTATNSLHLAMYTRWDLYKKLGSPEIKTYDDLLNVLKKMQDLNPKNDKGQKVYALQLWSDWDSISMSLNDFTIPQYKGVNPNTGTLAFTEYDLTTKQLKSVFDADSAYMSGIKFYFKANQMGILDPDSITQKWPNGETKTKEGRVLTTMWAWQSDIFNGNDLVKGNPEAGMIPLFPKDEAKCNLTADSAIGREYIFAIGKKSEYADRIIKLLDYCSTAEGSAVMMNGVQGSTWDIVNGKAEFKPEFLEKVLKSDDSIKGSYANEAFTMLNKWNIDPRTGESLTFEGWSQVIKNKQTAAEKEWAATNNCLNVFDYAKKNLAVVQDDGIVALAAAPSDDIKVIQQKLGELLKTYSWKMVYAKTEADFTKLQTELAEKAKAVGADMNFEWAKTEYASAKEKGTKYTQYTIK